MTSLGKVIIFKISPNNDESTMKKFSRRFYGYLDRSHNYRYKYQRKGFLDDFPYIKPHKGVIVVRKDDAEDILAFLESYNAEIFVRDIILVEEDIEQLMPAEE
jgi:hypothetical protein